MADLDDICEGLAANLHALKSVTPPLVGQVESFLLDNPTPPSICVAGVDEIDYDSVYGRAGDELTFLIEACLPLTSDKAGQKLLRRLLAPAGDTSVKTAVESDRQLTSRLQESGSVLEDQGAACSDLRVTQYRGQTRFQLPNGTKVLLATWAVEVLT